MSQLLKATVRRCSEKSILRNSQRTAASEGGLVGLHITHAKDYLLKTGGKTENFKYRANLLG